MTTAPWRAEPTDEARAWAAATARDTGLSAAAVPLLARVHTPPLPGLITEFEQVLDRSGGYDT
ncbi:hypothetical protein, partial [Nocardiopsis protaetiae]